jgi:hypothetical protein
VRVGDVAIDDRNLEQTGALRGSPATLTGDDLDTITDLADENR